MNALNLTVLIIVLLIFVYILYYFFFSTITYVNSTMLNLNAAVTPYSKLALPTSARYAYGAWIYVNNLGVKNMIISRPSTSGNNISLYLDPTSPTLYCDLQMNDNSVQTTPITNNFPIQRWCFIIVSVDGQFVDYYLNGKLIKSEKKTLMMATPPDVNTPLYLGNNPFIPFDAYLGRVIQWTNPIDPQTAWTTYLNGNGLSSNISPYHANLSFIKDNVTSSTYQLW